MSAYCKYYKQQKQISYDGGITWYSLDNFREGSLYEECSFDCGYPIGYRWFWHTDAEICIGHNVHKWETKQITYDNGVTWNDMPITRPGEFIREDNEACNYKVKLTFNNEEPIDVLCNENKSIVLSDITNVGNVSQLKSAEIGNCPDAIGDKGFLNCSGLTAVTIPDNIKSIGISAFQACSSLSSITIPDSVTSIGNQAFQYCSGLTDVSIGSGVTNIGTWCFAYNSSLRNIVIPDSVNSIGNDAFFRCHSLSSITLSNSLTSIEERTFIYCSGLTSITIPSGVTSIGSQTFQDCHNIQTVVLPSNLVKIDDYAFMNNYSLTSIEIPNGVTSIGTGAFCWSSGLTSVTLPSTIEKIGNIAFLRCSNLTGITINALTPPILGDEQVFDYTNNCPIYVPCEAVADYKTASKWSEYADRITSKNCNYSFELTYLDGTEKNIFCGELGGTVTSDQLINVIGSGKYDRITDAVVRGCVTNLDRTFSDSDSLSSVTISEGVQTVGTRCFSGCESLTNASLPNSLNTIGYAAFANTNIKSINIPSGVTSIGQRAFSGSSLSGKVVIPSGVTEISYSTFRNTNIKEIELGENITKIAGDAFYNTGLQTMTLKSTTPPTIPSTGFSGTSLQNGAIYVPCGYISDYKNATGWSNYSSRIQANSGEILYREFPTTATTCENNNLYFIYETKRSDDCGATWQTVSSYTGSLIAENTTLCGGNQNYELIALFNDGTSYVSRCSNGVVHFPSGYDKSKLYSLILGSCTTKVESKAFMGCSALTGVTVYAETPPAIWEYAFDNCPNLSHIYVPCGSFAEYMTDTPESSSQHIWSWKFYKDLIEPMSSLESCPDNDTKYLVKYDKYDGKGQVAEKCSSSTTINQYDIEFYSGWNGIVYIYNCVTSIGKKAFYGSKSLRTVIWYGNNASSIGDNAFTNTLDLDLTIYATTPPALGNNVFSGVSSLTIKVPANSVNTYKTASGWSNYASHIEAIP